jgi:flagellar basal-body rod protein FlgB
MDHSNAILILKALDGLQARSVATAENIANAHTPNYRPLRVSFEDALKQAAAEGDDAVRALSFDAVPAPAGTPDAENRLDLELATQSATVLRYSALVQILSRSMQMRSTATRGG